jgi:hypothetical protein
VSSVNPANYLWRPSVAYIVQYIYIYTWLYPQSTFSSVLACTAEETMGGLGRVSSVPSERGPIGNRAGWSVTTAHFAPNPTIKVANCYVLSNRLWRELNRNPDHSMTRSWFAHVTRNTSIQTSDYRWKQSRIAPKFWYRRSWGVRSAPAFRFVSPPDAKACR